MNNPEARQSRRNSSQNFVVRIVMIILGVTIIGYVLYSKYREQKEIDKDYRKMEEINAQQIP